jgi:hypothetical protein
LLAANVELTSVEYVTWVNSEENGFFHEKKIGEIEYSLLLKPQNYVIARENLPHEISAEKFEILQEELGDLTYFDFRITIAECRDEILKYNNSFYSTYQERVNYCSFKMQEDIKLVQGMDTILCNLFHFERAFDLTPYLHFLIAFPSTFDMAKTVTFLFEDNLFDNGYIKIGVDPRLLTRLPKLKLL